MVGVTPPATSEHNSGCLDSSSIPMSFVASCVRLSLRPLPSTGVTRLPRYGKPLPHPTRPDLSLASCRLILINYDHRWGFPCCSWSTLHACRRPYPGRSDGTRSLVLSPQRRPSRFHGGLAPAFIVSRPAQRSLHGRKSRLRHWIAGYGVEKFHPITQRTEFSDHLAGAVLL